MSTQNLELGEWDLALLDFLEAEHPAFKHRKLLLISPIYSDKLHAWCTAHDIAITYLSEVEHLQTLQPPYDFTAIHHSLETLPQRAAKQMLGLLHNSISTKIWVSITDSALEPQGEWALSDWLSLGFKRVGNIRNAQQTYTLFGYDLASYNRKRSWNNPKFWANPANWNKYRW